MIFSRPSVSLLLILSHWKFDLILLLTRPVTRLPKLRAGGHRQGWNRHAKQLGRSSNPKTACKRQKAKCCPFLPKCWTFAGLLPYNWFLQIVAIKNYFVNTLIFILSCGHENAFFICPSVRRVAEKKIRGGGGIKSNSIIYPYFLFSDMDRAQWNRTMTMSPFDHFFRSGGQQRYRKQDSHHTATAATRLPWLKNKMFYPGRCWLWMLKLDNRSCDLMAVNGH